jgi:hypothetical protein
MQVVGKALRKADPDIWVNRCLKRIEDYSTELNLISDVRFPNEVDAIHQLGGIVIRLTLNKFDDKDESETALDNYQFDYIIDNQNMNIHDKNLQLISLMEKLLCLS